MRRILLLLMAPALVSCADPHSAQQAKVQQAYDTAMVPLERARHGYIPGKETSPDLQSYRQKQEEYYQHQLDTARMSLETLVPLASADPLVQVAADRVLSDIYDSNARTLINKAVNDWAALSGASSRFLNDVLAVDRADELIRHNSMDGQTVANTLDEAHKKAASALEGYTSQQADFKAKIDALTAQMDDLQKQINTVGDAGQQLSMRALTATGQERYDLYAQSSTKAREANRISEEQQKLGLKRDLLAVEDRLIQTQVEQGTAIVANIQTQIDNARTAQARQAASATAAKTEKDAAVKKLQDDVAQVVKDFEQNVTIPLAAADVQMGKAIENITSAQRAAASSDRRQVQLDLMAKQLGRAHLQTLEVVTAGDLYRRLNMVAAAAGQKRGAADTLIPHDAAEPLQNAANAMLAKLTTLVAAANQSIADLTATAGLLTGGNADDPVTAKALAMNEHMTAYSQQVAALDAEIKKQSPATPTTHASSAPAEAPPAATSSPTPH